MFQITLTNNAVTKLKELITKNGTMDDTFLRMYVAGAAARASDMAWPWTTTSTRATRSSRRAASRLSSTPPVASTSTVRAWIMSRASRAAGSWSATRTAGPPAAAGRASTRRERRPRTRRKATPPTRTPTDAPAAGTLHNSRDERERDQRSFPVSSFLIPTIAFR